MTKVVSIYNQKGGVGKTTTNINLSAYVSLLGYKVLVIDADPQGNTTSGFGFEKDNLENTLYDGMVNNISMEDIILKTRYENLDLVPSDANLAGAEIEINQDSKKELRIRKLIDQLNEKYDYIFIDCPPSLGLISINALTASHSVLIPIQCEYYAIEGVSQLVKTIDLVRRGLQIPLEIEGIVLTMYDGRTNLSLQVAEEVRKFFKDKVFETMIPRNVRLAEAPSYGETIEEYDSSSKGAIAYKELAEEFIKKGKDSGE
ncbi:chromosome partitioning protein [Alkalibaculum bacchi]|uniref:Sporulation initiation inhibitor protein Soj n=1 Tax=Alkalibaculum bacchi TaxID=645887 RepID=A0A366I379_9FIRM|nr:ParA family protein [Alkalibaculum bacchi]RBP62097.1 chromosome partitioning protein [Alkalibaculum bacchi]